MITYSLNRITVGLMLDNRRRNVSGCYPVKVRVTYKRDRKYYSTGKELSLDEWDKLDKTKLNTLLNTKKDLQLSFDKVKEAVQYLEVNEGFSFEALNTFLGKGTVDDLNTAFTLKIENLKVEGRIGTQSFYECTLNNISKFVGNHISFDSVTVAWLKNYEKYMLDEGKSYTTVGMYMKGIRAIFNDAIKMGKVRSNQYPFGEGKYEIPVGEGRKLALTLKQIKEIITYTDGLEATEHYRDLWFFSYLCNGINIVDLLKLKFKDIENGELSFYRSKTIKTSKKKTKIKVVVTSEMERIINRWGNPDKSPENYIFPFLNGNKNAEDLRRTTIDITKRINLRMSNIAKALNLPHISTYTARHSFATVLKRSGANIAFISESLGHSDLKTTENYLASFEREEREKNAALLTNFDD